MTINEAREQLKAHQDLMQHLRELDAEKMRVIQSASLIRAKLATFAAKHVDCKETAVVELRGEIGQVMTAYEVARW